MKVILSLTFYDLKDDIWNLLVLFKIVGVDSRRCSADTQK